MNIRVSVDEIKKAINILKFNSILEIRILDGKNIYSGYFKDADNVCEELKNIYPSTKASIYFTLNRLNNACLSKTQSRKFVLKCNTTSDNDVTDYDLIMIDIDPNRVSDTSSSNEELAYAYKKAADVYKYLKSNGFNEPVVALSGNGYHLLYKVDFPNCNENINMVKSFLDTLSRLFSDKKCKVDTVNYNPSRICKLYGSVATKGSDTEERPHRLSKILYAPDNFEINDVNIIKRLIDINKPDEVVAVKPTRYNNYSTREFNLMDFIQKHNIEIKETGSFSDGTKYVLKQCPFDSSHTKKDAAIFSFSNGALGFKCMHNSCSDKHWKDFRKLYEPDAYDRNYNFEKNAVPNYQKDLQDMEDKKDVYLTAKDIVNMGDAEYEYIPSGVASLDELIGGIAKGKLVLVSGLRASGKSSMLGQFAIEAVNSGFKVMMYSGELSAQNVLKWLNLQIAGKNYTLPTSKKNVYVVNDNTRDRIAQWLDDKLIVYNNNYGNDFRFLEDKIIKAVTEKKVDLVILDNLMTMDISGLENTVNEQQKKLMMKLSDIAKRYKVAIIFVAHPRKSQGFLRLEDVSGTNDIVNLVDDAVIVHRNNIDFKKKFDEMMKPARNSEMFGEATNIIEICKNREHGVQDEFIKLFYEVESKRLKNSRDEIKNYGWLDAESEQFEEPPF